MDNDEKDKISISESGNPPSQTKHIINSTGSSIANLESISQTNIAIGNVNAALESDNHQDGEKDDSEERNLFDYWGGRLKGFLNAREKPSTSTESRKLAAEDSEAKEQMRAIVSKWLQTRIDEEYLFVADTFISKEVPGISEFCKQQLVESLIKLDEVVASGRNHAHSTNSHERVTEALGESMNECEKAAEVKRIPQVSQGENEMPCRISGNESVSTMCRICYHESRGAPDLGPLVSPCNCRGSVQMVHMACLQRWLSESGTETCDLCGYRFRVRWIQRTSILTAFFAWICTEEEATQLLTDLALLFVMTPMVMFTAHRCLEVSHILFVDKRFSHLLLVSLLLLFGYFAQVSYYFWIISAFFYHAHNWLRWWRGNFGIEILPPDTP